MGKVVKFVGRDAFSSSVCNAEPATIIILPVVYVDRGIEQRVMDRYAKAKKLNGNGGKADARAK